MNQDQLSNNCLQIYHYPRVMVSPLAAEKQMKKAKHSTRRFLTRRLEKFDEKWRFQGCYRLLNPILSMCECGYICLENWFDYRVLGLGQNGNIVVSSLTTSFLELPSSQGCHLRDVILHKESLRGVCFCRPSPLPSVTLRNSH